MLRHSSFLLPAVLLACGASLRAQIVAYHNVTSATHQSKFTSLSKLGYRPISLSVHGSYYSPRYTAVWQKKSGPLYYGFHDLPIGKWAGFYNARVSEGFVPEILSFNGSGNLVRVAGIFVKSTSAFAHWFGQTEAQFRTRCKWAQDNGFIPTSVAIYGTSTSPLYAVVFKPNTSATRWNYGIDNNKYDYQKRFDAYSKVAVRPVMVTHNSSGRYVSVWRDDRLVSGFYARHAMSAAMYQYYFNLYGKSGFYPVWVTAAGIGSGTRWDAIFVKNTFVAPRNYWVTGTYAPALAGFDSWMKNLMLKHKIRAAGLAIAWKGELKYARGFTYAETGYPITQPTSMFRIASMSKPLTSIAIHKAQLEHRLSVWDYAYKRLPPIPSFKDLRTKSVRIIHMLAHMGGWDINILNFDPMFSDYYIASKLGVSLPISNSHVWNFMSRFYGLQWNPGTHFAYSNYGFSNLGLILAGAYNTSYGNVVQSEVMIPLGLKRPFLGRSYLSQRAPGEVLYHPRIPGVARTVRSSSGAWVPVQYGGWSQENMNANGGWVMAPADYAKILASFDAGDASPLLPASTAQQMWTPPFPQVSTEALRGWFRTKMNDAANKPHWVYNHNGGLPGTSTIGFRRDDGLSIVVMCNADIKGGLNYTHVAQLNSIANKVKSWPSYDLFPSLGIRRLGYFAPFGQSCKLGVSTPAHSGVGKPYSTQTIGLKLTGAVGAPAAVLYIGFSKTHWGLIGLPLALDALGAPGCKLYVPPQIQIPRTVAPKTGTAIFELPIPSTNAWAGLRLYSQYLILAPKANQLGLVSTNGLETRVGG